MIGSDPPTSCPSDGIWDEIAAGLLTGDDALQHMEHASWCPQCAAALQSAIEIFSAPETLSPTTVVAIRSRRTLPPGWLTAAAMALVAVGLGFWYWQTRPKDALGLLAQAYTSDRTLDLRLPGAAHGQLRLERGAASHPPTVAVEAELAFRRELDKNPDDPVGLHARGRWEILYGSPDRAIESLQAALDLKRGGADPELLTELAMAYRERAIRNRNDADRLHAIELLGQALQADPNNPSALFNRAAIERELNMLSPAIADLEKLLTVEPSGAWSDEARESLNLLRKRHAVFFRRAPGFDAGKFDEAALEVALQDLHATELGALAARLENVHHDPWLAELLRLRDSSSIREAEATLAGMAEIRLTFQTAKYATERANFDKLYGVSLPAPLAAWRDFESLYRATHARGEFRCAEAGGDAAEKRAVAYKWITIQRLRERGTCALQAGDADTAAKLVKDSVALANAAGYPVLAVRSEGLRAGVEWRRGMYRGAIQLAARDVNEIFEKQLPVARSQEFFNMMMASAEDLGWWHAAQAGAAEMTEAADVAGFRDLRFTDTVRWAQLSLRCGDVERARAHFKDALGYYADFKTRPVSRAWAEIGFADATGDESSLLGVAEELEGSPDPMVWIPYERVRARLALSAGRLEQAHARLERISNWLNSPNAIHPSHDHHWRGEFRESGELMLQLLLTQGRATDAFLLLQQWKANDERSLTAVVHPARAPDENAVKFAVAEVRGRLAVWRSDGAALEFRWATEPAADVSRLARRLTRMLESPESSVPAISSLARQIGTALFGSWLGEIAPDRAVIIQCAESIGDLAFAVLPGTAESLGLEHQVSTTPLGFPLEGSPMADARPGGEILLLDASAGNQGWAPDLPPLASGAQEVEGILSSATLPVDVLERGALSIERIRERASSAKIMHFVGHAVETPMGVSLVIPDVPGPVVLRNLAGQGFRIPPIVVLSACSTGKRSLEDSAGPDSLATGFLLEGSGEVIASLWNVNSEGAKEFMTEFYRGLGDGRTTGTALRRAMRRLAHSNRFSHPYYWATFARFIRA